MSVPRRDHTHSPRSALPHEKRHELLHVTNRNDWRAWLAEHHATETEIWLVSARQHTGKPQIPYDEAVEEALCYGWIDSVRRKVDDDHSAQRFSPRKDAASRRRSGSWKQTRSWG